MLAEDRKRLADLEAAMRQMLRVGMVSAIYPERHTVRVSLPDADNMVSHELPVLTRKAQDDKFYCMPDVGEQVLCLFLPYGLEQGFVVGAFFSSADRPPIADPDCCHVLFKDGTSVEYDRALRRLTVDCVNEIEVRAANHVLVRAARIDLNQ